MRRILFIYPVFAMHFDIRRLRFKGKPIEDRKLQNVQPLRGDVYIRMDERSPMGRPSLIAEILKVQPSTKLLPPLYDVQIHGMATLALVITGTEIIDGVAYAQSWHCRVV
ncbi:hypothetical protein LF844_09695 [Metapseudomonas lalkuanensis]|uniref:hypothetical protein n=1 Tax=Metapseudomonas lalkuanensis TaxID=2604832 RepID=UPI001CF3116C|nr:hypothetical protein [Pseudomonas lalkuanensis]UCP00062.1 hypothetical protein LF844_09695 [Pseudomonas lalkuanensis]